MIEPSIIKMVGKRLVAEGYDVTCATDGEEAMRILQKGRPDLMVLDVMMPKLDGYEVCRRVKSDVKLSGTRVVLLTAKGQTKDRVKGFANGAEAYMCKPFRSAELLETIRNVLEGQCDGYRSG
jgi:DNA-binding response OmpR family regulator